MHPAKGLVGQNEQTAHHCIAIAEAAELDREELVAFEYDDARSVSTRIGEGAIAETRHRFHGIGVCRGVKGIVDERAARLEIDDRGV